MAFLRFIIKIFFLGILILALTLSIIAVSMYYHLEKQLPDVEKLKEVHLQVPLRVYSADKKLMAQFGTKRRIPVSLHQVPKMLINAVLATEDARFYKHSGVDLIGIGRATLAVIGAGRKVQGASTITMQVARNFYLSREKTYVRKVREILLALKIDKELDKDKILELYLNKIYFGNRAYGVAAAAQVYFGKTLNQLTLAQMAMIAGLPQAPSRNNPIENPESALKRRNHVLARMLQLGDITKQQYERAVEEPLSAEYHAPTVELSAPYVSEMVREAMVEEYGDAAYERGLTVYTTVRSNLQRDAELSLRVGLLAYDQRHGFRKAEINLGEFDQERWQAELQKQNIIAGLLQPAAVLQILPQSVNALLASGEIITIPWAGLSWARPQLEDGFLGPAPRSPNDIVKVGDVIRVMKDGHDWRLIQVPEVQGAIVALNPQNGAILALSGGFDYNASNFNRAIQAERQPGSNFKPFIYSAALNKGYTLASVINDAPIIERDNGENRIWRPTNDSMKFYGPTPLRVGLVQSRNVVSVRLLQEIGVQYALHYIQRFGFDPNVMPHGLTLALGTGSATPLQIAVGYSVFANGGYLVTPYFIQKILDQHENVLYQAEPAFAEIPRWHPAVHHTIIAPLRKWRRQKLQTLREGAIKKFIRTLRETRYDVIIDAQSALKTAIIGRLARGHRAGMDKNTVREYGAHWLYHDKFNIAQNQHAIIRLRQLFANSLGYSFNSNKTEFGIDHSLLTKAPIDLPNQYILCIHSTTWKTKHWPEHYWQDLIKRITQQNLPVYLPWASDLEKQRAERLATNNKNAYVLPRMTLSECASVIKNATAAIAVDTGLGHLCAALETPAIHLYGPTDPNKIGARGKNQIILKTDYACAPCYLKDCNQENSVAGEPLCYASLQPEWVWHMLENCLQMLSQRTPV